VKKMENLATNYPLFIAEVSGNHLGNLERCLDLVDAASFAGATAVKFQTFSPETMTLNLDRDEFRVSKNHELWGGQKLFDLYNQTKTPREWHRELFSRARDKGLIPFSSPFDFSAVDFLETLDCSLYKIASLETSDLQLIAYAASTGKPIIISTGATYFDEIRDAVEACLNVGNSQITLLVCTSSYPAQASDANLRRLELLRETYNVSVGLSDHTLGIGVSVAAIALGATVIEKHLTISRSDGGPDSAFSLEPNEYRNLVTEGKAAWDSLGTRQWQISESENESRRLRRSLYITKDVKKGEFASVENIAALRPGYGVSPKFLSEIVGRKFVKDFALGTSLQLEYVEDN